MSAFMVSTDHVDAILSFVNTALRQSSMPMPDGRWVDTGNVDSLTEVGKALLSENIKSLQARYPSDWNEMVDLDVNEYAYTHDGSFIVDMGSGLAVAAIKLCDCLGYQSCEHDGWEASYAKRFLDHVRSSAIGKLPGYQAAPWSYDRRVTIRRIA